MEPVRVVWREAPKESLGAIASELERSNDSGHSRVPLNTNQLFIGFGGKEGRHKDNNFSTFFKIKFTYNKMH